MSNELTVLERQDGVLTVRLNNMANRNALSAEMKDALFDAAQQYVADQTLRCLVITGTDKIFCAGGDLRGMADERSAAAVRARLAKTHRIGRLLATCEKPVICAVNGAAIGAGLALALLGDIVVMADDGYFMSGFSRVGLVPDGGIIYTLPRAVGPLRAREILMTNRRIDAAEALSIGLVSRVLPRAQFDTGLRELALQIANGPSIAYGLTKSLLNSSQHDTFDEYLTQESLAQVVAFDTEDFVEGVRAFAEKRDPQFKGK